MLEEFLKTEISDIMSEMIRLIDKTSELQQDTEFNIDWANFCDDAWTY